LLDQKFNKIHPYILLLQ